MRWGTKEYAELFKLVLADSGKPHPAVLDKPALRSDCIRYYDAYRYLSVSRLWTEVGPQAIQLSEVTSYLELAGILEYGTKLKYLRLIQLMDRTELKFIADNRKTK